MPRYSVIVPVYNAEGFLERSVGSVLRQTFEDWELILIDDGSSDSSSEICRKYSESDKRIKFISKANTGVSDTRNAGIAAARGEYIVFLDADDYLSENCLEASEAALDGNDAELVVFNYSDTDGTTEKKARPIDGSLIGGVRRNTDELIKFFLEFVFSVGIKNYGCFRPVWAKVFRTDIIKKNNLLFDKKLKYGEDALFLIGYVALIERVVYSSEYVYYYMNNPSSAMNNKRWEGAEYGEYYFRAVEAVAGDRASELSLSKFWFNIVENDWRVLSSEPCGASFKKRTLRKLFKTEFYRRFSRADLSKSYGKKQKLEAFFIRHGLTGMLMKLYGFLGRKTPKKKRDCTVYVNFFAERNYGDDAFVFRLIGRYPNVRFILRGSEYALKPFEPRANVTLKKTNPFAEKLNKAVKKLTKKDFLYRLNARRAAVCLTIGGSVFIEPKPQNMETYFRDKSAKFYPKKHNLIIGANFGPYKSERFSDFFRKELARYDDVTFRDKDSYSLFEELGNVRYVPDILFGIGELDRDTEPEYSDYVVISVIDRADDREAYIDKIRELAEFYGKKGLRTVLLALCENQGDAKLCRDIQSRCPDLAETVVYDGDVNRIINLIKNADYVIASRFHAVITAFVYGVPCFPVVYSNKTENMLADIGFKGESCDINSLGGLSLPTVDSNRADGCTVSAERYAAASDEHFAKLDELIASKKG